MMATILVVHETASRASFWGPRRVCLVQEMRIFAVVLRPERMKIFTIGAVKRMVQTIQKNIRVTPEQWKRIENEAEKREMSPNRLVVELVMEALDRREWPRTEAEIHLLRSAMFTAQAIIRDMERAGREEEIEQISKNISEVAPELPGKSRNNPLVRADSVTGNA